MTKTIVDILEDVQKTFATHRRCVKALRKIQSNDPQKFTKDFIPYLNRILVVFKREPAVERLIQFIVNFSTFSEDLNVPNEEFAVFLIGYLLEHTDSKEKGVRFRTTQLIANLINAMGEESELE